MVDKWFVKPRVRCCRICREPGCSPSEHRLIFLRHSS